MSADESTPDQSVAQAAEQAAGHVAEPVPTPSPEASPAPQVKSPEIAPDSKEVLATAVDPDRKPLELRRAAGGFEIVSAGRVVMQSAQRRSERELVNLGMVPLRDRNDITVLVAGLGMGYLVAALLESPRVIRVDVVEHCAAIIEWNKTHLAPLHREPPLDDARVQVHNMSLAAYLRAMRYGTQPEPKLESGGGYLALFCDLDDGPSALSRPANEDVYSDDGLADLEMALRPGGVIALWSAQREPALIALMNGRFQNLAEIAVPVDVPGHAGLDYIYRGRKRAPAGGSRTVTRAQA